MHKAACLPALVLLGCCIVQAAPSSAIRRSGAVERVTFEVSTGTKLAADVSPDGKTVAFDLLGQIWMLPVGGGQAQQATDAVRTPAEDTDPSFSPDGKWIAFGARRPGGPGIWLLPVDGGPVRRLTANVSSADPEPAWSPDSSRLAFVSRGALAVVDISTGVVTKLRIEGLKEGPIRNPAWSADGRQIAFVHGRAKEWTGIGPDPGGSIYAVPLEGGKASPLLARDANASRPAFSPDSKRLAFFKWQADTGTQAWVADLSHPAIWEQSHDITEISYTWHLPHMFFGRETPQWSPDSRALLLFEKAYFGSPNTARIVDQTGRAHKLDRFPPAAVQVQWAPNGTLVYVDNGQLWSVAFDPDHGTRGEPALLWDGPAIYPSVSRDGSVLFVANDGLLIRRPAGEVKHLGWPLLHRVPKAPAPLLIQGAKIISENAHADVESDILIRDGRIRRIASRGTIAVESGCQTIAGAGRWVIPGLIKLGTYLWEPSRINGLLHHGITTVQDMGSAIGAIADLRDSVEAGLVPGPRIFFVGLQFFPGADPTAVSSGDIWHATAGASGTARGLALAKGFGASSTYIYQARTLEDTVDLIRLARESGLRTSYARFPPLSFIAAGLDRTLQFPIGESCQDDLMQLLRASGVSHTASIAGMSLFGYLQSNPATLQEPDTAPFLTPYLRGWGATRVSSRRPFYDVMAELARSDVRRLHQAGGVVGIEGAGIQPLPWAFHRSMEELVNSGFSPREALRAATLVNAQILGVEHEIGTVDVGKVADLLLLDADPLEDIRNTRRIQAVIQGRKLIDRKWLTQPPK